MFGGDVPEARFYTLAIDSIDSAARAPAAPRTTLRLAVDDVKIAPEYRTDRLAYRESPYDIGYYGYHRWAAPPEALVRRALRERLAAAGLFASVEEATGGAADLRLEGVVEAIVEVDAKGRWSGRLALALALRDPARPEAILSRRYDVSRPAAAKAPIEVVKAIGAALDDAVAAFVADAEKALARRKSP